MRGETLEKRSLIKVLQNMQKNSSEGFYFFLSACEVEDLELCQVCLESGMDVNIKETGSNCTLIQKLAYEDRLTIKIADWLIENGANLQTQPNTMSLLGQVCFNGNFELARYFHKRNIKIRQYKVDKNQSDLYWAIDGGNEKIVKWLIEEIGVDIEIDVELYNPFLKAIRQRKAAIIEIFLRNGANPNFYYYGGRMPLHEAVANDDIETVFNLLKYKAEVNSKLQITSNYVTEYYARYALDIAKAKKNEKMQKMLVAFGAISSK